MAHGSPKSIESYYLQAKLQTEHTRKLLKYWGFNLARWENEIVPLGRDERGGGGGGGGDKRENGKRDESCWRGKRLIYLPCVTCEKWRRPSCGKLGLLATRPWPVIYGSARGRVNGPGPLEQIQPRCTAPSAATMDLLGITHQQADWQRLGCVQTRSLNGRSG